MNENRLQILCFHLLFITTFKNEYKGQPMKYNNMTCDT
jgi:hypothetical protein